MRGYGARAFSVLGALGLVSFGGIGAATISAAPAGAGPAVLTRIFAAPVATGTGSCAEVANACTLTTALSLATAGATVLLTQSGIEATPSSYYVGNWEVDPADTTSSLPIIIRPLAGVTDPILDGNSTLGATCPTASCDGAVLTIGSGVYADITGITIQDASNSATGDGGGISNGDESTLTVSNSTFTDDDAGDGGAIDNGDNGLTATLSVTDSTFSTNDVGGLGGAIDNGDNGGTGILTVSNSTFSDNGASYGGGAIASADNGGNGTLSVWDSTFWENHGYGGAIENVRNAASGPGTAYVAANIFYGGCYYSTDSWEDLGYNVGSDGTCENGGVADSTNLTSSELGALADNGGSTQTMILIPGNPAIGVVPNDTAVSLNGSTVQLCPTTDQRGVASPAGQACGGGAVQDVMTYPAHLYAAPAAVGTGSCLRAANACTLTSALALSGPGSTVYLTQSGKESDSATFYVGNWNVDPPGTTSSSQITIEPKTGVTDPILDGDNTLGETCPTATCTSSVLTTGSGVYATITGVTIQDGNNTTTDTGGGVANGDNGTLTVSQDTFSDNSAFFGGAIGNGDGLAGETTGTLTVSDSTFSDNAPGGGNGGAIDNGDDGGNGTATVSDSTFFDNSSGNGGAIDNGDGGGTGTLTLIASTLSDNNATGNGPAIDNGDGGGTGTVNIAADIFDGSCAQTTGTWNDAGYNVGTGSSCENGGPSDSTALAAPSGSQTHSPQLGSLANNGGPTETMLPLPNNPAIEIAPNPTSVSVDGATVALCPTTDQRGDSSGSNACEAGAVQGFGPVPAVLYAAPSVAGTGSCSTVANACTLATALTLAGPGTAVRLTKSGNESDSSTFYVGNWVVDPPGTSAYAPVTIEPAPGVQNPILDGDAALGATCSTTSCSGSVLSLTSNAHVAIQGLTIQDGSNTSGGGISVSSAYLALTGSTLTDDSSTYGGAIASGCVGGTGAVVVVNSTFTSDSAYNGGAIDSACSGGTASLTVIDSTFTSDSGYYNGGSGGAIDSGDGGSGTLSVTGSTFTGDSADNGGAIDTADNTGWGSASITNSTFTSNGTSYGQGGAVSNGHGGGSGTLTVTGSTFVTNSATSDGGGIDNGDGGTGTLFVSTSTFSGDGAGLDGGAIDNGDNGGSGTATVAGSTFSGNGGDNGGGIDNGSGGATGVLTITDSTFASNGTSYGPGGAINNYSAAPGFVTVVATTFSGNGSGSGGGTINNSGTVNEAADIFDGSCYSTGTWRDQGYNVGVDTSCYQGNTGDTYRAGLTSELGSVQGNGGLTQTILPLLGNPALNRVPNDTTVRFPGGTSFEICPTVDQRGFASPSGGACDAGSVQLGATTTSTSAVTVTYSPNNQNLTLQATVDSYPGGQGLSGGTVTFTVEQSGNVVGTPVTSSVESGQASAIYLLPGSTAVGGYVISAVFQPGTAPTLAPSSSTAKLVVSKATQTITFTSTPPTPATVGGTYDVSATGGGSGNAVTFGVGSARHCTISGNVVAFVSAGTCVVSAYQLGNGDYFAAPTVTQAFLISEA